VLVVARVCVCVRECVRESERKREGDGVWVCVFIMPACITGDVVLVVAQAHSDVMFVCVCVFNFFLKKISVCLFVFCVCVCVCVML
jgi:hypothetical protein